MRLHASISVESQLRSGYASLHRSDQYNRAGVIRCEREVVSCFLYSFAVLAGCKVALKQKIESWITCR